MEVRELVRQLTQMVQLLEADSREHVNVKCNAQDVISVVLEDDGSQSDNLDVILVTTRPPVTVQQCELCHAMFTTEDPTVVLCKSCITQMRAAQGEAR